MNEYLMSFQLWLRRGDFHGSLRAHCQSSSLPVHHQQRKVFDHYITPFCSSRIISVFPQDLKEYPLTKAPCRTSLSSKQAPVKNKNSNKDVRQSYKSEVDKDTSSTTVLVQGQDTQTDAESLRAGKG